MKKGLRSYFVAMVFILFLAAGYVYAAGDVKFKILAVNPSASRNSKALISQALPNEIDPNQDIVDKAGLEVKYDSEKKIYLLTKEVELKPKETRTFEVRVRDVWRVTPEAIEETKKDLATQMDALKDTKFNDTGKLLFDKAQESLDRLVEEQNRPLGIKQRIELYRAHVQQLQEIKKNALSMDAMRRLEEEKKKGVNEARFYINAENPSSEPKTITVRSFLPREITPDDVLDRQDFNLLFDQMQRTYFLDKQEKFASREKKKYIIAVRDIWRISESDLAYFKDQTEKLVTLFKESPYNRYADEQGKVILSLLAEVSQLQTEVSSSFSLEERTRAFVLNSQKFELAKSKIHNLQQLLPEISLNPSEGTTMAEKLKYLIKKLAEMKDLVMVALGLRPDRPATWWLILGIIAFLAILTVIFYFVWIKRLGENRWEKKSLEANKGDAPPEEKKAG